MKLEQAETFHAVMSTGNASGAARRLHVTQPAATRVLQLADLVAAFREAARATAAGRAPA